MNEEESKEIRDLATKALESMADILEMKGGTFYILDKELGVIKPASREETMEFVQAGKATVKTDWCEEAFLMTNFMCLKELDENGKFFETRVIFKRPKLETVPISQADDYQEALKQHEEARILIGETLGKELVSSDKTPKQE